MLIFTDLSELLGTECLRLMIKLSFFFSDQWKSDFSVQISGKIPFIFTFPWSNI